MKLAYLLTIIGILGGATSFTLGFAGTPCALAQQGDVHPETHAAAENEEEEQQAEETPAQEEEEDRGPKRAWRNSTPKIHTGAARPRRWTETKRVGANSTKMRDYA